MARVVSTLVNLNQLYLEPQYEKMYLIMCMPNEDSNQPADARSLISIHCSRLFTSLAIQNAPGKDSDQIERMPSEKIII